jgi:hypothetical protein
MNKPRKMKTKFQWAGIIFVAVLLCGQELWAKIYSVQIGVFQNSQNAQHQFILLKKSLPSNLLDHLRIEKTGKAYVVKVGKLDDLEQALTLLSAVTPLFPDAFIWRGDLNRERTLKTEKIPTTFEDPHSKEGKVPMFIERKNIEPSGKSEIPSPINQSMLRGTIREINSVASDQLGMPSGKNVYRLIILVEETKEINGFPDYLKEKEGELLTVFSETNPPFFKPGNKIVAIAEYRGNRFSRFYWINKPQAVKP